jgi:hypothetical protein
MSNIIEKIKFKPGTSKADFLAFTEWMGEKVLAEEMDADGHFVAVCLFDDGIDYLAFLATAGFVKVAPFAGDGEVGSPPAWDRETAGSSPARPIEEE